MSIWCSIVIKLILWYVYIIATTLLLKFLAQLLKFLAQTIRRKLTEAGEEDTGKIEYFTIMLIFANFFISGYVAIIISI